MLRLIIGKTNQSEDICNKDVETIRDILRAQENFLTGPHRIGDKIMSILRIAKYRSQRKYGSKQIIINTIVDVGYSSFKFSVDSVSSNKRHILFFVAAKGKLEQLKNIVEHLEQNNVSAIHDTYDGETVLSFMIKFGDYLHENFLDSFKFMLQKGIDVERVDYFKSNLKNNIKKQIILLEKNYIHRDYLDKLKSIENIVNTLPPPNQNLDSRLNPKSNLFQTLIKNKKLDISTEDDLDWDDGENTLLQLAIIEKNVKAVKDLLDNGANPNRTVEGRNEEAPLVLAAILGRETIFKEILNWNSTRFDLMIDNIIFGKIVRQTKRKYLYDLLEWKYLNIDIEYKENTPLFYAIKLKNHKAIQTLLQRGSRVDATHLSNINPKDLEKFLNSCIKSDHFGKDANDRDYKSFLVFDFFMNSLRTPPQEIGINNHSTESERLISSEENTHNQFDSEVAILRNISDNKRLKHLLEHPLVYIYIMLKWQCVLKYYFFLIVVKSIFYMLIDFLIYVDSFNSVIVLFALLIQILVFCHKFSKYKLELRRYTINFILKFLILLHLGLILFSKLINEHYLCKQISAFLIIFTSVSVQLTIGYHLKLTKWTAMIKRVFISFSKLILFFMVPIIAFAMAFKLLFSVDKTEKPENVDADFSSFFKSIFKIFIFLGGDIGDNEFYGVASYVLFLLFTISMSIILLNFLTGVAVSDIKGIEEQSTIIAFQSVIEFIEDAETNCLTVFDKMSILKKIIEPRLKPKICLEKENKFSCGIHFYINSEKQFKNSCFEKCRIPKNILLKIVTLLREINK